MPPPRFLICVLVCFLFGCTIFDLKNPQAPSLDRPLSQDPLNIRVIFMAVPPPEVNDDMNYRDYFTDDATFSSFNFPQQGKENILRMLDRLRLEVSTVDWQVGKAHSRPENNNQWIVTGMPYIVYSRDRGQISGKADFRIVKGASWMISEWKDMPDDNASAFFEPY